MLGAQVTGGAMHPGMAGGERGRGQGWDLCPAGGQGVRGGGYGRELCLPG
jgi:hypothetical protein